MLTSLFKKISTGVSGATLLMALLFSYLAQPAYLVDIFYFISLASGGYFVFRAAIRGLFKQHFLNINFLVSIAALGALYIRQLPEAASVVFFFSLAEAFEDFGLERSRKALEALIKKSPQTALLINGKKVHVEQVKINDIISVRSGDLIPLDGVVMKGSSSVDEATITGESVPKDKQSGDTVFAGTLNQQGYLEIKVTKESKNSTFAKIIQLVRQAQKSRPAAQEFIDRFAKYYTPAVVMGAVLISTLPPLLLGEPITPWFYRALVLLVIACPCALVISTPVSIASALGTASRRGVLVKGGKYLELLGKVKIVAFDKTRTLTEGEPYISDVVTFDGFSEEEVLAAAAGVEAFSSHPLARSILEFAKKKGITPHAMDQYQNVSGKGGRATCRVCDDVEHCVGNLTFIKESSVTSEEIITKTERLEQAGKTVSLISKGDQIMGALAIADKLRQESRGVIKSLYGQGILATMLTGDNPHTAQAVAQQLDLPTFYASLLPEQKLEKIKELKQLHGVVAMVGDGVNDAPSLVEANVGIAMGASGADVAIETADVALMNSNLTNVPYMITLGRKTMQTIKLNIAAALGVKAVFLVLALAGFTHLEYAIGADSGMAILVILNSLRLFRFQPA